MVIITEGSIDVMPIIKRIDTSLPQIIGPVAVSQKIVELRISFRKNSDQSINIFPRFRCEVFIRDLINHQVTRNAPAKH